MRLWRILSSKYASDAFSSEGARLYGGRWHRQGTPMVYTASSLALASVEVFVNLSVQATPAGLVAIPADLPDTLVQERITEKHLPANWREVPSAVCQAIGSEWF